MKKTMMALATQRLGSVWGPEQTKPAATDLPDMLPHDGEVGGRDDDSEAMVTVSCSSSNSRRRGGGRWGIPGATSEMGIRVLVDDFIRRGRRRGGHPTMAPWDGYHAMAPASPVRGRGKDGSGLDMCTLEPTWAVLV